MKNWIKRQLSRTPKKTNHKCNCGRVSELGYGYFCFQHNKQTPNVDKKREVEK